MTLQASGAIDFSDINVEMGVASNTQRNLGSDSSRGLSGIASGAISMSNFYGKSNFVVSFPSAPYSVSDGTISGGNPSEAQCGFRFKTDGTVCKLETTSNTETQIDTWIDSPPDSPGEFEILCTHTSGSETPTNEGSWLTLDSDRDFIVDADGGFHSSDSASSVGTFQIRHNGGAALATADYDMSADSEYDP